MASSKSKNLFPSEDLYTSNTFKLEEDIALVKVHGLKEGDRVCVEVEFKSDNCSEMFIPYVPSCKEQLCFEYPQTEFMLTVPNRYRLVLSNDDDEHLNDPAWFTDVEIVHKIVNGAFTTFGGNECCDPDKFAVAVAGGIPDGWNIVMNDGTLIPFTLTVGDGLSWVGTHMELDLENADFSDVDLCPAFANFQITNVKLGG